MLQVADLVAAGELVGSNMGDGVQGMLSALGVARLKSPGMYGGGLWLQVTGKGAIGARARWRAAAA